MLGSHLFPDPRVFEFSNRSFQYLRSYFSVTYLSVSSDLSPGFPLPWIHGLSSEQQSFHFSLMPKVLMVYLALESTGVWPLNCSNTLATWASLFALPDTNIEGELGNVMFPHEILRFPLTHNGAQEESCVYFQQKALSPVRGHPHRHSL